MYASFNNFKLKYIYIKDKNASSCYWDVVNDPRYSCLKNNKLTSVILPASLCSYTWIDNKGFATD